jgi:nucleoredoxin
MLAQYYQRMKASGRPFEVVFVSCDKDQGSFSEYLSHMPWLAIPFASDARESALAALRVQGIPQLTVFAANGKKVEQNAVQKIMQASPDPMDAWERGESAP